MILKHPSDRPNLSELKEQFQELIDSLPPTFYEHPISRRLWENDSDALNLAARLGIDLTLQHVKEAIDLPPFVYLSHVPQDNDWARNLVHYARTSILTYLEQNKDWLKELSNEPTRPNN